VVVEEHARRAVQLGDDDPLGAVDDEGAVGGHERDLPHVHLLLLHVLDRLARGLAVIDDQTHGHAQRGAVAHATGAALALVEGRLAELVADVLQRGVAVVAADREHRLERGVQAAVGALGGVDVFLQELAVGIDLDRQQEGDLQDRLALAEVLADALLLGERVIRRGSCGHGELPPRGSAAGRVVAAPGEHGNCQLEVAGIAGTSTPSPATSDCQLAAFYNGQRPGAFAPSLRWSPVWPGDASTAYFTSTEAPAASRSFFIFSASSFDRPSFTSFGALSTRSLASFRPRPVMARTTLMVSTFFSPAAFSTTVNSVCSSAAAAPPAAGAAATATGAAAETPNFSSIAFTSSITSTRLFSAIASMICSLLRDISYYLGLCVFGNDWVTGNRNRTGVSGRLRLASRVDDAGDLRRRLAEQAPERGGGLGHDAAQHRQRFVAGRQRGQDIHVGARVLLPTERDDARLQLVVRLGELLDQASGSTRILLREGIQQRTDQLVLDDGIVGVFHRTRDQRVLGNLQIHARLAGLLAQVGQLADREAHVLRGDQRVRLGGDLGQFGNDFLLLGQIESHCTPPYFNSTGCDMHAGGTPVGTVWPGAGTPRGVRVVAVSRNPGGSAP